MRTFIRIISILKYFGLLGLPIFFSDWYVWKLLWLFWLFGIMEVILIFPSVVQGCKQLYGMVYTPLKYSPLPNKDTFQPRIIYSLPFEGEWTAVNGGVTKKSSHSWDFCSQRYAYDFIILSPEGVSHTADGAKTSDYYCYGKAILAPADGVVVEIKDSCKDSLIMGKGRVDPLVKDIRGNYILLQHADSEFSCLAHLKPGSIRVSVGQKVFRKQPIASCGNSGNTSEPHLHFQVQSDKSFFLSAGLPIHFEDIETISSPNYSSYDPRPVPESIDGFISRGQNVRNCEKLD